MKAGSRTRRCVTPVLLASLLLAAFQACAQSTSRVPVSDSPPAAETPPAAEAPPVAEAPSVSKAPAAGDDPRVGLAGGMYDAETAAWNMELVATVPKPEGPVVARAYLDQIGREDPDLAAELGAELDRALGLHGDERVGALTALAARTEESPGKRLEMLAATLREIARRSSSTRKPPGTSPRARAASS